VVAPDLLVDALPYRPPAATAAPGPARLLSVLIPGFAVLAAALVAVYLLGVTLPVWLLIAVGGVGALAVTGVAVSGERKRRLARRRADALGVVRSIVGEFGVALGRQAHNAVGGLHQELRRATAASVVARFAAVAEELDAIQGAAETAARGPAELAAISEDLDTLTDLRGRAARLLESRSVAGLTLLAGGRHQEPVRAIA
jgi:hypothetical protein